MLLLSLLKPSAVHNIYYIDRMYLHEDLHVIFVFFARLSFAVALLLCFICNHTLKLCNILNRLYLTFYVFNYTNQRFQR